MAHVDGRLLERVSEFKYLGCDLDESGTYEVEYPRKVVSGKKSSCAIRTLVNVRGL